MFRVWFPAFDIVVLSDSSLPRSGDHGRQGRLQRHHQELRGRRQLLRRRAPIQSPTAESRAQGFHGSPLRPPVGRGRPLVDHPVRVRQRRRQEAVGVLDVGEDGGLGQKLGTPLTRLFQCGQILFCTSHMRMHFDQFRAGAYSKYVR